MNQRAFMPSAKATKVADDVFLTSAGRAERIEAHPPLGSTLDPIAIMGQPNPWGFFLLSGWGLDDEIQ